MKQIFFARAMKPIVSAVYPCGCEVIYSALGYSPRACGKHGNRLGFPYRIRKYQFIDNGVREGDYILRKPSH